MEEEIKDGLVVGLVSGLVVGIAGLIAGLVDGIIIGIIIGLVFGLVVGLAAGFIAGLAVGIAGLVVGLSFTFTTQLIGLITSNPKFMMFDFIVSGILLILILVVGWSLICRIKKQEKKW